MGWGREKPKGFIDDAQNYQGGAREAVVVFEFDQSQIGIPR
jgi:hypothetical protein